MIIKNPFNKDKDKLKIEDEEFFDRAHPDCRNTVTSMAKCIHDFIKKYLDEPNNCFTKDELSVSVTISDGKRTLYDLTALRNRSSMSTDKVFVKTMLFRLAKGQHTIKIRIGVFVKARYKNKVDRSAHIYNAIERHLENKYGKSST